MKRHAPWTAALLGLMAICGTGCGGAAAPAKASPTATASASPSASAQVAVNAGELNAEKVKTDLETRIETGETAFGSGSSSPCSPSSPQLFTARCASAADATLAVAAQALRDVDGRSGFATLDGVARKLRAAGRDYDTLGCANGPAAADVRQKCLVPASVLAQGFEDLRDGANLALAGR